MSLTAPSAGVQAAYDKASNLFIKSFAALNDGVELIVNPDKGFVTTISAATDDRQRQACQADLTNRTVEPCSEACCQRTPCSRISACLSAAWLRKDTPMNAL